MNENHNYLDFLDQESWWASVLGDDSLAAEDDIGIDQGELAAPHGDTQSGKEGDR
jgi:hypothetical protein